MTTVTHNKQQYSVTKQSQDEWRLTSVERPRDSITLSAQHMREAGFGHIVDSDTLNEE